MHNLALAGQSSGDFANYTHHLFLRQSTQLKHWSGPRTSLPLIFEHGMFSLWDIQGALPSAVFLHDVQDLQMIDQSADLYMNSHSCITKLRRGWKPLHLLAREAFKPCGNTDSSHKHLTELLNPNATRTTQNSPNHLGLMTSLWCRSSSHRDLSFDPEQNKPRFLYYSHCWESSLGKKQNHRETNKNKTKKQNPELDVQI